MSRLHLVALDVGEALGDGFDGALHVGLEDDLEDFLLTFFDVGEEVFHGGAAAAR